MSWSRIMVIAGALGGCGDDVDPIEPATTSVGVTTVPTGADGTASGTTGPCLDGQEGCPCTPGGACDPGLMCLSDVCVDIGGSCPVGSAGCPCTPGGGCDLGLMCVDMVCVDPES